MTGFLVVEVVETTETSDCLVVGYELFLEVAAQESPLSWEGLMYLVFYSINGYLYYSARAEVQVHLQVPLLEEL